MSCTEKEAAEKSCLLAVPAFTSAPAAIDPLGENSRPLWPCAGSRCMAWRGYSEERFAPMSESAPLLKLAKENPEWTVHDEGYALKITRPVGYCGLVRNP